MTGTGIIHSNNLQICPGGFQSGRVTGTNTLSINNYLSPPPPPPRTSHLMFQFPMTPRQVDVFQRRRWGWVCGTGTGQGRAEGCVLAPLALGARRPRCPDGAPGEGGEGRASPARFWAAAGALAALPGRTPRWARCHRAPGRSPPFGSVIFLVRPQFCELPWSADRPQRPGTYRGGGGDYFGGRLCPRCGGEEGRRAAWQGFVLPKRERAG